MVKGPDQRQKIYLKNHICYAVDKKIYIHFVFTPMMI